MPQTETVYTMEDCRSLISGGKEIEVTCPHGGDVTPHRMPSPLLRRSHYFHIAAQHFDQRLLTEQFTPDVFGHCSKPGKLDFLDVICCHACDHMSHDPADRMHVR